MLLRFAVRARGGAEQNQPFVGVAARQVQVVALIVHPELVPLADGPVVEVETLAAASASSDPVLVNDAAILLEGDIVGPGLIALHRHIPVAHPEVELSGFRLGAPDLGGTTLGSGRGDPDQQSQRHRARENGSPHACLSVLSE